MDRGMVIDRPLERRSSFQEIIWRNFQGQTLSSRWIELERHPSGFDYMRVILAASVLLWHSYLISYGRPAALEFWKTPAGFLLEIILPTFFALSGFLVSGSLERSRNLRKFLTLRLIRIYPALCVEVFLSALILGPVVTQFALRDYFTSLEFYKYMLNTIGWIHYFLPGVFLNNPFPAVVNTSLWTVPFELECYIVLPVLVLLGFMRSRIISVAMFVACTFLVIGILVHTGSDGTPPGGLEGRVLVLCFLAGTLIYRLREWLPYSGKLAFVAGALAIVMLRYNASVCFAPVFVAYVTVYLGMANPKRTFVISNGDYSYGLYLYAGPVQQTVALMFGAANSWTLNVAVALPVTILFALFSWHFVEKPFQKVKRYVMSKESTPS
jgi:peptidoglycan/LPS O-acetylase OafA/YrhL